MPESETEDTGRVREVKSTEEQLVLRKRQVAAISFQLSVLKSNKLVGPKETQC